MKELQIFNNPEFGQVRMVEVDGRPFAVGVDVARVLEYAKPSQAVIDHCKGIRKLGIPSGGGEQETNIIPEGDIYRLIVKAADQSKNEIIRKKAERFERWIFDEVLPAILKHGMYLTPDVAKMAIEDKAVFMAKAVLAANDVITDLTAKLEATKPAVAFVEKYVEATALKNFREVAKIMGIREREFIDQLINWGIVFRQGGTLLPYANYQHQGYFEVKTGEKGGYAFHQTRFTPAGIAWIAERLMRREIS